MSFLVPPGAADLNDRLPAKRTTFVWEGPYGSIVIEVEGDAVFVNGTRVEPAASGESEHQNGGDAALAKLL